MVITQNIDELHRKAGTKHLLEIHGKNRVICLLQASKLVGGKREQDKYWEERNLSLKL